MSKIIKATLDEQNQVHYQGQPPLQGNYKVLITLLDEPEEVFNEPKLCLMARQEISNFQNRIYVSSASAWEIATKYRLGKMPEAQELLEKLHDHFRTRSVSRIAYNKRLCTQSWVVNH